MPITGYLSEFSLSELFQFLDQGHKTGLLTICDLPNPQSGTIQCHYIWFSQGRIVGATSRLDSRGLLYLISQRNWLSQQVVNRILKVCSPNVPIGLYLKSQGLLQAQQLKLLFSVQVLREVCALFSLSNAYFEFDRHSPVPMTEMTGLSTPGTEVILAGLRTLRNWTQLEDKLPDPTSALVNKVEGKPRIRLDRLEWQVWEFTNGTISIAEIAEHLNLPTAKTQQVAFRLMIVGLVKEVPIISASLPLLEAEEVTPEPSYVTEAAHLSAAGSLITTSDDSSFQSFFKQLFTFLQNKL